MAIGSSLERQIGTIMMALTIFFGILLTGAIYISISWLLFAVFGLEKMMLQHAAGFSGVIFQLSVLESNLSPNRTRSVFGVFTVSSRMYPWALLVAIQLVMPHISFLGHLSGILIGSLQYHGALNVLFPREEYLQECETSERLSVLRAQPSYVPTPESTGLRGENGGGLQSAVLVGCGAVVQSVKNLCEAVRVIVFGRGAEMNSNIQLGVPWDVDAAAGLNDSLPLIEEDEEWAGLPEIIQRSTEER
ncbi:hypothetical protein THAOC_34449 [Thalassiosira oceanica]|uniref:Peptidase S54 rhomboid domain-containing protein n=1 Tax=Thalassiosira oceanica TaxID=159749 RepID=K0RCR0_THAOC|nr:hypothetical protein THAOC_34449 [Thalassiosira oceanica]|eukprot:EJK46866.1 hypothetical protein THAOC_34449 [Thalassiosira oceanica]